MQTKVADLISQTLNSLIWYPDEDDQLVYAANVLSSRKVNLASDVPANWDMQQWETLMRCDYKRRIVFAAAMLARHLQYELNKEA